MIPGGAGVLLNFYLLLSVCVVLFDLTVMLTSGRKERDFQKRRGRLSRLLEGQLQLLAKGRALDEKAQKRICRLLRKVENILAFSELAEEYAASKNPVFRDYIARSGALFGKLSAAYGRREPMQRAAYAWALSQCAQEVPGSNPFLADCILESSIYCRENALTALYRGGNQQHIVSAMKLLSRGGISHSPKLVGDGLLACPGDRRKLCALLWEAFPDLSDEMRLAVIDFMKLSEADYRAGLLSLLENPATGDELCYAAIRYFGRVLYGPARRLLVELLNSPRRDQWEYAAVSAASLRGYRTRSTVEALKRALCSPSWYVRYNAAESLVSMDLPEEELRDVLEGGDRFGREILCYMLERKNTGRGKPTGEREEGKLVGVS